MAFNLAHINVHDLTGMVATTSHGPVGRGNFADVWKGTYARAGHKPVVVRTPRLPVTCIGFAHISVQVAVKVLRTALLSDRRLAEKVMRVNPFPHRSSFSYSV